MRESDRRFSKVGALYSMHPSCLYPAYWHVVVRNEKGVGLSFLATEDICRELAIIFCKIGKIRLDGHIDALYGHVFNKLSDVYIIDKFEVINE